MLDFRNDLISYIQSGLNTAFGSNVIKVVTAYKFNYVPTQNEVAIQMIDDREDTRTATLSVGETISNCSFQVYCYGFLSTVATVKYTAQDMSILIADTIKTMFAKNTITASNSNIKTIRRTATAPTMPIENGSKVYVTSIRFETGIDMPYTKIY